MFSIYKFKNILRGFVLVLALVISVVSLQATSPRKIMIEEFTNASCPLCAAANPDFNDFLNNNTEYIPLVYHTWWPGANDPMYTDNTTMNRARIDNYYSVSGIPSGKVNGTNAFLVSDISDLEDEIDKFSNETSPISIFINVERSGNSGTAKVTLASTSTQNNKKLRIAVVEQYRYYSDAGNNGEVDFYYMVKDMLPSASGRTVNLSASGSQTFSEDFTIGSAWTQANLHVVAFIQDDITKEVLQVERAIMSSPSMSSPADAANEQDTDLTFSWGSVTGASRYKLLISTDSSMTDPDFEYTVTGTSKRVTELVNGKKYYWTVLSEATYGTNWSGLRSFRTLGSVTISNIPASVCQGGDIDIPFTTNSSFNSNNVFTAQLSDANGGFTSPREIGTLNGSTSGTINATFPSNLTPGDKYRIRVISSSPATEDSEAPDNLTVNPLPVPEISGKTAVCSNNMSVFTATEAVNNSYAWEVEGGSIQGPSDEREVTILWGDVGNGTLTLVQTIDATGCSDTKLKNITINSIPTPEITGINSVCESSIEIYSAPEVTGNTYLWRIDKGSVIEKSPEGNIVTVLWEEEGEGYVKLLQINPTGCTDSVETEVTITPKPAPEITGVNETCQGIIHEYMAGEENGNTYEWIVSGGRFMGSSDQNSVRVLWDTAGTGILSLVQTNDNSGCFDTAKTEVEVWESPNPEIAGASSVCSGVVETYAVEQADGNSYKWMVDGGFIDGPDNENQVNIIWGASGGGSVSIIQTVDASSCSDTIKTTVVINQAPDKPVITGAVEVCPDCVEEYFTSAEEGMEHLWIAEGGDIVGENNKANVLVDWGAVGSGRVEVVRTNSSNFCTETTVLEIDITSTATVGISGSDEACSNSIESYSTSSNPAIYHEWFVTGGTIQGAADHHILEVLWPETGNGEIKLVYTRDGKTDSVVKEIMINQTPDKPVITEEDNMLVSSSATGNHWYLDGNIIPGANEQYYTPKQTGNYSLVVISENNCESEMSEEFYFVISSVSDFVINDVEVEIFPNPVSSELSINTKTEILNGEILITNIMGQELVSKKLSAGQMKIDMNSIANGVYILQIKSNGKFYQKEIIVVH